MFNLNLGGRFADIWKKAAASKIQQMETAREFWGLIAGFVFLRLITSIVSIFSGFAFFRVNFAGIIDNPTARIICATGLLAVIEVITAAFLFKMFKFIFAYRWGGAVAMFIGVAIFYSVSFYTSTRGIALYKSDTTEQYSTVNEQAAAMADSVRVYYSEQINILRANIDAITPPRWNTGVDGKPQLTTAQQNTKTELYNKILSLQSEQRQALQKADADADATRQTITRNADADGNKYAGYVCVIMILQLIANGVLCFLYSRIYHENNRGDEITADIKNFAEGIATDTDSIIKMQISEQYGNYLTSMQRNLIALRGIAEDSARIIQPSVQVTPINNANTNTGNETNETKGNTDKESSNGNTGNTDDTGNESSNGNTDDTGNGNNVKIRGFAPDADTVKTSSSKQNTNPVYTNPVYTNNETNDKTDNESSNKTNIKYIGDGWKYCELCGKPYQPRHSRQKYCSESCKFQACANRNNKIYTFGGVKYYPQSTNNNK